MGRRYTQRTQRHGAARVGYIAWQGAGTLIMMGLMMAGFVVLCICIGSDLFGVTHS